MIIDGLDYRVVDVYDQSITVPDSFVINENKTGKGHGEAKLYMGSKDSMRSFYTGNPKQEGFVVKCFVLKRDLISLLKTIKHEYQYPSIKYRGIGDDKNMLKLWKTRMGYAEGLPNKILFEVKDQQQIMGPRGYVNSIKNRKYKKSKHKKCVFIGDLLLILHKWLQCNTQHRIMAEGKKTIPNIEKVNSNIEKNCIMNFIIVLLLK